MQVSKKKHNLLKSRNSSSKHVHAIHQSSPLHHYKYSTNPTHTQLHIKSAERAIL
jgi:hypothetical protein